MSAFVRSVAGAAAPRALLMTRVAAVRRAPIRAFSSASPAGNSSSSNTPFIAVAGVLGAAAIALGLQSSKDSSSNTSSNTTSKPAPVKPAAEVVSKLAEPVAPPPPPPPPPAPLDVPYVIVGGGTAAYFAVRGILARDKKAKIIIVSTENELPYARTPLSKELWFNAEPSEVFLIKKKQKNKKPSTTTTATTLNRPMASTGCGPAFPRLGRQDAQRVL
jgi:hypothetical protein